MTQRDLFPTTSPQGPYDPGLLSQFLEESLEQREVRAVDCLICVLYGKRKGMVPLCLNTGNPNKWHCGQRQKQKGMEQRERGRKEYEKEGNSMVLIVGTRGREISLVHNTHFSTFNVSFLCSIMQRSPKSCSGTAGEGGMRMKTGETHQGNFNLIFNFFFYIKRQELK